MSNFFVLEHLDRGHAGGVSRRYLNSIGRWAVYGTVITPLLAWVDPASAQAVCSLARALRRDDVILSEVSNGDHLVAKHLVLYSSTIHAAALASAVPTHSARQARQVLDGMKTAVYARAVLAIDGAAEVDRPSTETAWNRTIQAAFGGGSMVSASQFLAGKRASAAIAAIRSGAITPDVTLPLEDVLRAVAISQKHTWNCGPSCA